MMEHQAFHLPTNQLLQPLLLEDRNKTQEIRLKVLF
jgi:hypothetical protein